MQPIMLTISQLALITVSISLILITNPMELLNKTISKEKVLAVQIEDKKNHQTFSKVKTSVKIALTTRIPVISLISILVGHPHNNSNSKIINNSKDSHKLNKNLLQLPLFNKTTIFLTLMTCSQGGQLRQFQSKRTHQTFLMR